MKFYLCCDLETITCKNGVILDEVLGYAFKKNNPTDKYFVKYPVLLRVPQNVRDYMHFFAPTEIRFVKGIGAEVVKNEDKTK